MTHFYQRGTYAAIALLTAAAPALAANGSAGFGTTLAGMPGNSWSQVNLNAFLDAAPPEELRALGGTSYSARPDSVIYAWSGFAWDSKRSELLIYGGGHANYAGNEVYKWSANTQLWGRASLPSQVQPIPGFNAERNWVPVDGAMNAPPSAHTYDNTNYLPAIDRMLVLGGAAFQSGSAYTVQVNATTSRVTGPYLFDPAKADATKVGGTDGSGADVTQPGGISANSVGGQMWQNRDASTAGFRTLSFVEGTSAATVEGGHDVVYFTAREGGGTASNLYRYEISDVNKSSADTLTKVGTFFNSSINPVGAPFAWGAAGYDPVSKLYVHIGTGGSPFVAWDLDNAGPLNPSFGISPTVDGGSFSIDRFDSIDWDPVRRQWLVWEGGGNVWSLKAPSAGTVAGQWLLTKIADGASIAPALQPKPFLGTGGLGKWHYAADLDAFVALEDNSSGSVWVFKPEGGIAPIPEPATWAMTALGLMLILGLRRRRNLRS